MKTAKINVRVILLTCIFSLSLPNAGMADDLDGDGEPDVTDLFPQEISRTIYQAKCSPGLYDPNFPNDVIFANGWVVLSNALEIGDKTEVKIENLGANGVFKIYDPIATSVSGEVINTGVELRVTKNGTGISAGLYANSTVSANNPIISFPLASTNGIKILFNKSAKTFTLTKLDGSDLIVIDASSYWVNTSSISIGAKVWASTGFSVGGLAVQTIGTPSSNTNLVTLAQSRLTLGALIDRNKMNDQRYCAAMENFNAVTFDGYRPQNFMPGYEASSDNGVNWSTNDATVGSDDLVRPTWNDDALNQLLAGASYAKSHGWKVHASHLTWGSKDWKTEWLWKIPGTSTIRHFTPAQYKQVLTAYVEHVVSAGNGKIDVWSVANEFFNREVDEGGGANSWLNYIDPNPTGPSSIGRFDVGNIEDSYLALVLTTANAADPDAVLMLNDYNNESANATDQGRGVKVMDKQYDTVEALLNKDIVPATKLAVGMQMHINAAFPPLKNDVITTMQRYMSVGVQQEQINVYITEIDVDLTNLPSSLTLEQKLEIQARIYRDMLEACLESINCVNFTTWGVDDPSSVITAGTANPNAKPLLFGDAYTQKPAYTALKDALSDPPVSYSYPNGASDNDHDGDEVPNDSDNCITVPNNDQETSFDAGIDGIGEACWLDDDHDGVTNYLDKFPSNEAAAIDADNDGKPDVWNTSCDLACQAVSGLILDDADNDGIPDVKDANPSISISGCLDTDGDGAPNSTCGGMTADNDDDDDTFVDANDAFPLDATEAVNSDGDAYGNNVDTDDDGDGVLDVDDAFPKWKPVSKDTDHDGVPDDWNASCNATCRANNSGLIFDGDDDGDGVSDTSDKFPLDPQASIDTDDDDMPDAFTIPGGILLHEQFEAGDFNTLPWVMGGDQGWVIKTDAKHSGTYSASAGAVTAWHTSSLSLSQVGVGNTVSFWFKTSTESHWDLFNFYVDDVLVGSWSGVNDWTKFSYSVSSPGQHNLKWEYTRDGSTPTTTPIFDNTVWIDDIDFGPSLIEDGDDDDDSVADAADAYPLISLGGRTDTDGDGRPDECDALAGCLAGEMTADTDDDNDSFVDSSDNCTLVVNLQQSDLDHDGYGNACDADLNNDDIVDVDDLRILSGADLLRWVNTAIGKIPATTVPYIKPESEINPELWYEWAKESTYAPGNSGLGCAGVSMPCPAP